MIRVDGSHCLLFAKVREVNLASSTLPALCERKPVTYTI